MSKAAASPLPDFDLPADMPLAIDVDGTLLRSDITQEMFWLGLLRYPWAAPKILRLMVKDRPALKAYLMPKLLDHFDPAHLPYNPIVLDIARRHHAAGGDVILCSGSEASPIKRIAAHFDFIDDGFGTGDGVNLVMGEKAKFLRARYPDGYAYIGNSSQDFDVWKDADCALAIEPPAGTEDAKDARGQPVIILEPRTSDRAARIEANRLHLTPFYFTAYLAAIFATRLWGGMTIPASILALIFGFVALWYAATGLTHLYDLNRVKAHRSDAVKRHMPLASGRLSATSAAMRGFGKLMIGGVVYAFLPPTVQMMSAAVLGFVLIGFVGVVLKSWLRP